MTIVALHEDNATQDKRDYFMASEEESERLSNQHMVIKDAMPGGRLICPTLNFSGSPLRILDSGTADGIMMEART